VSLSAWKSLIVVALSEHSGFGIDRERLECVIAEARSTCRQPKAFVRVGVGVLQPNVIKQKPRGVRYRPVTPPRATSVRVIVRSIDANTKIFGSRCCKVKINIIKTEG
jgi:hypothetical protein